MNQLGLQIENNEWPVISIIMPVYNSEKYISDAIESVLHQTYTDFELLLIDDGSSDQSPAICDEFAKQDYRIRVFHKDNGGVCSARNLGIRESRGEYITFIDNDDLYLPKYLEVMVTELKVHPVDIIRCGRKNTTVVENGDVIRTCVSEWKSTQCFKSSSFLENYFQLKKTDILNSVWNGLYRREFITSNGIWFNEIFRHGNEDVYFNLCCFLKYPSIIVVKDVLYEHFYRLAHSTSMKYHENQIIHRLDTIDLEKTFLKSIENTREYKLVMMGNIRVCFKILSNAKDLKKRKEGLKLLEQRLPMKAFKQYKVFLYHELSPLEKIELVLIKYRLYNIFFIVQTLKQSFFTNVIFFLRGRDITIEDKCK